MLLQNRSSFVLTLGNFSSLFSVLSGVPKHLLLNTFINDPSTRINYSKFLLFGDNLEIDRGIKFDEDCKSLQANTDLVLPWCCENYMEVDIQKTSHVRPKMSFLILCYVMF
jgi:hypothetical protein